MNLGGVFLKVIDLIFCEEKLGASFHILQQVLLRCNPLLQFIKLKQRDRPGPDWMRVRLRQVTSSGSAQPR